MSKKHSSPTKAQESNSPITDIVQFFAHITDEYQQFEQNIVRLISKLPTILPKLLAYECKQLRDQKAKLELLDNQMFDILDLAGKQIIDYAMIQDYRIALSIANMASEKLYRKLQEMKTVLQEDYAEFNDIE